MNRRKDKLPMEQTLCTKYTRKAQTHKLVHNGRVNSTPDNDPTTIEHVRDHILDPLRKRILLFVDNTTKNQEPGIDFNRNAGADKPAVVRPNDWTQQVNSCDDMMLGRGKEYSSETRQETWAAWRYESYLDNRSRALDRNWNRGYPVEIDAKVNSCHLK